MKTLAIPNINNNAHFLRKNFKITREIQIEYVSGQLKTNFDYILFFDSDQYTYNEYSAYITNSFGIPRYSKLAQHILLAKHNISCPNFFYNNKEDFQQILSSLDYNKKYYLKANYGARKIGTFYASPDEINTIESNRRTIDLVKLANQNGWDYRNNEELEIIRQWLDNPMENFIITEDANQSEEYRILLFYDQFPIICHRSDGKYTNDEKINKIISRNEFLGKFDGELMDKLRDFILSNNFLKTLNTPFLSIDLYINRETQQFGIFEFQMQFGYRSVPISEWVPKINNSVHRYIYSHNNYNSYKNKYNY